VIAVSDRRRSNDFYKRVLGAEIDQKDEQFGHYRFDDWQLNIRPELVTSTGSPSARVLIASSSCAPYTSRRK